MANQELDPIIQAFVYETEGMLEQIEQILLDCEEHNGFKDDDINEIFRIMHTIKGGAGMMWFNMLADLAHSLEDMFYFIREENPSISDITIVSDNVLSGIDFMKVYIEGIKNNDYESLDAQEIIKNINDAIDTIKSGGGSVKVENKTKSDELLIDDAIEDMEIDDDFAAKYGLIGEDLGEVEMEDMGKGRDLSAIDEINLEIDTDTDIYSVVLTYQAGCEMENIRAFQVVQEYQDKCVNLKYFPDNLLEGDSKALADIIKKKGFQMHMQIDMPLEELRDGASKLAFIEKAEVKKIALEEVGLFDDSDEEVVAEVKEVVEDKPVASVVKEEKKVEMDIPSLNHEQKRINVPVEKLDLLMDLVGELVLSETMVVSNPDLKGIKLDNFSKAARQHRKIIGEVQDIVMSIRMMPLSTTFTKMKRIVRDISKKLDRDMQIELIGEETEVDKNIIEQIGDPLMHLVRNAADHGIESKEEREKNGKLQPPKITLEACNSGGDVLIKVIDNGKGLDKDKILKKAMDNNLIDGDASELTDKQIFNMIFLPGFSTTDQITEFSGRGVGMDVVRNNIEGLGGTISIDSVKNEGTTVTLKIPLTLAIVSGMIIRVGKAKYTIPIMSIQESFRPTAKDIIIDTDGNEMVMVRGGCYIIRRLSKMYNVSNAEQDFEKGILIMLESNDDTFCIFADEIIGEQQVVVKPLPDYVKRFDTVKGIAGCTLLGDGDISLILDVANINN